ncbi:hypothetical protein BC629DRAFT_1534739 [Irpex lacteus]|nr:hypothetical protein BC629DRAFT_1534739 [Irpex lacteus]
MAMAQRREIGHLKRLLDRYKQHVEQQKVSSEILLKTLNDLARQDNESPNARIETLLRTISDLVLRVPVPLTQDIDESEVVEVDSADDDDDRSSDSDDEHNSDASEEEEKPSYPAWDETDMVFRCRECSGEVLDGVCWYCGVKYDLPEGVWDPEKVKAQFFDSEDTNSAAHSPDRVLAPRGDSPPPEIIIEDYPELYKATAATQKCYRQLCSRGATRAMCETFELSFTKDTGIVAVLTPAIKEIFGGRDMSAEDRWELYLGRAVRLDGDDLDGSNFVTGLLEDILFFSGSHFTARSKSWETIRDPSRASAWITRPSAQWVKDAENLDKRLEAEDDILDLIYSEDEQTEESDEDDIEDQLLDEPFVESGPTLHRDEYTPTNSGAGSDEDWDDSDSDGLQEVADLGYAFSGRYDDLNWSDGEDEGTYSSEPDEPLGPQLDPEASDNISEDKSTSDEDSAPAVPKMAS